MYDHRDKSGNPGDVVKHVALTACVDVLSRRTAGRAFRYADAFAGFPEADAGGPGWADGVGRLRPAACRAAGGHVALWYDRCAAARRYPGSTVIVTELLESRGIEWHLSAWDTSAEVVDALRRRFVGTNAVIHQRPARAGEADLTAADLVLVDPPGIDRPGWPGGAELRELLAGGAGAVLCWLPVLASAGGSVDPARPMAKLPPGFEVRRVPLPPSGRLVGCDLAYRLESAAADAVGVAVEQVRACW
jgi:23S rRNA A2030 N6-methylase RlmJ